MFYLKVENGFKNAGQRLAKVPENESNPNNALPS